MFEYINSKLEWLSSKNSLVVISLSIIVLFVYGNILFGDFVFDDNIFIENNMQIRSPANIEAIYQSSTTAGSGLTGDNFYRPNQQFIYTILYSFFGLNPFFFHLVPILFHILNGFLLFLIFIRLGISRKTSFLSSLLFLLHPVLTQAVSYISGLSEPLVGTTILGTVLIFQEAIKNIERQKFYKLLLAGISVFIIGLFSKESQMVSLIFIALIYIFQWRKGRDDWFRPFVFIGLLAILFSLYMFARVSILNFTGNIGLTDMVTPYTQSIWVRLSTFVHILPEYFKMILFPWNLNYEKPYIAYDTLASFQSILGLTVIVGGLIASLVSLFKRKEFFLGFMWFLLALVPVSGIIPVNSMYLEHWLYMPIIGIILLLAFWFEKRNQKTKNIATLILVCILFLFSVRIIARNIEWGNPIKFYQNELRYTQDSARIFSNLAMEQADAGDCQAAIPNYLKAIEVSDSYPQSHHNLARCYIETKEYEKAANEYLRALYIEPNFSYSLIGLYNLLGGLGDTRSKNVLELIQSGRMLTISDIENALK